jgi:hypothetical protein
MTRFGWSRTPAYPDKLVHLKLDHGGQRIITRTSNSRNTLRVDANSSAPLQNRLYGDSSNVGELIVGDPEISDEVPRCELMNVSRYLLSPDPIPTAPTEGGIGIKCLHPPCGSLGWCLSTR